MLIISTKTCTKCEASKELSEFYRQSKNKDGYMYWCKSCVREYEVARKDSRKEYYRRRYEQKPESYQGYREKQRTYQREYSLQRRYGITINDYNDLFARQDYKCAICKRETKDMTLHVDHSHITGEVRGLLCFACNRGLGSFKDDVAVLENAIDYINEWRGYAS